MRLYRPEGAGFWGDYGRILINGLGPWYCGREDGLIALHRTGPFVPPISFPDGGIVVTDDFRDILEKTFSGLHFQPVVKKRIVSFRWENWDKTIPEPKRYPAGGEPENYILKRRHSEKVANEVGPLWELIVKPALKYKMIGDWQKGYVCHVLESSWNGDHFLSLDKFSDVRPVVTETAKEFLDLHAGEWIDFNEVAVVKELPRTK